MLSTKKESIRDLDQEKKQEIISYSFLIQIPPLIIFYNLVVQFNFSLENQKFFKIKKNL